MSHALSGLEPKLLWDHFAALAAIPRGSKNEAAATAHVVVWPADSSGSVDDRRHWHTACWTNRATRGPTRRWS